VRQLPVSGFRGVPAIVMDQPQGGSSHLKVKADNLEDRREKKLSLLLEVPGAVEATGAGPPARQGGGLHVPDHERGRVSILLLDGKSTS